MFKTSNHFHKVSLYIYKYVLLDLNASLNMKYKREMEIIRELSVLIINDEPFISQMIGEQLKLINI